MNFRFRVLQIATVKDILQYHKPVSKTTSEICFFLRVFILNKGRPSVLSFTPARQLNTGY
jgi:hypothetical protein